MSLSYVNGFDASTPAGGGTSFLLTRPAGWVAGDLAILAGTAWNVNSGSSDFVLPAGWVRLSSSASYVVAFKVTTATEPQSWQFTSPVFSHMAATVTLWRGAAHGGTAIESFAEAVGRTSPAATADFRGSVALRLLLSRYRTGSTSNLARGGLAGHETRALERDPDVQSEQASTYMNSGTSAGSAIWEDPTNDVSDNGKVAYTVIIRAANTPPSAPGAYTSPTAGRKVSYDVTVAFGAATDPDGDALNYEHWYLPSSGAAWILSHSGPERSFNFPTAPHPASTTARWRVRAHDGRDFGPFTYSPYFTVIKPAPPGAPRAFSSPLFAQVLDGAATVQHDGATDPNDDPLTYDFDLTIDGGASWIVSRSKVAGTSYGVDYSATQPTTTAKWRSRAWDGASYGPYTYSPQFTVQHDFPPAAPTLVSPPDGFELNREVANTFDWATQQPQLSYSLRYRPVGAAAWTTIARTTTANSFRDFAALAFALGKYEWSVQLFSSGGAAGPWAPSRLFTAGPPANVPTITNPPDGSIVDTGGANVTWTVAKQSAYQLQVLTDAGAVIGDSGWVYSTTVRNVGIALPVNNVYNRVQVRVIERGLTSAWKLVRFQVVYTKPAIPLVTALVGRSMITLNITHPAPTGSQPVVTSVYIYRLPAGLPAELLAGGVAPESTYIDYYPLGGIEYSYLVRVLAANGASSDGTLDEGLTSGTVGPTVISRI